MSRHVLLLLCYPSFGNAWCRSDCKWNQIKKYIYHFSKTFDIVLHLLKLNNWPYNYVISVHLLVGPKLKISDPDKLEVRWFISLFLRLLTWLLFHDVIDDFLPKETLSAIVSNDSWLTVKEYFFDLMLLRALNAFKTT